MYFFIQDIEFEKLDDDGIPIELTDDESEKIGNYIARTVWEANDMTELVKRIESAINCKVGEMTFESSPVMPR